MRIVLDAMGAMIAQIRKFKLRSMRRAFSEMRYYWLDLSIS